MVLKNESLTSRKEPIVLLRNEYSPNSGVRRINDMYEQMKTLADMAIIEPKHFRFKGIKIGGFFITAALEFIYSFYFIFILITKYKGYKKVYLWPMSYTYLWIIPCLRLFGKKVGVDYNDDFYELSNKNTPIKKLIFYLYYMVPQSIVPYIVDFLIVTPHFKKRFIEKGIPKKKLITSTTGFDPKLFKKLEKKKKKKVWIGYFGSIDERFDSDFVVNSFKEIKDSNVELHFFGSVAKNHKKVDDKRIIYHGKIPHSEVSSQMNQMDILLNSFPYSQLANSASPVKVFEYMAISGCILSSNIESVKGILHNEKNSMIYKPSDRENFQENLKKLIKSKSLREKLGTQAKKDSENYSWHSIAGRIIDGLSKI